MGKFHLPTLEEDAAINKGIAEDPDTWEADKESFAKAKRGRPLMLPEDLKLRVTMMLDREVVEHYKAGGKGWQTRINADLVDKISRKKRKTG